MMARRCLDRALRWLCESDVRNANGGYRSVYRPADRQYGSWGGGDSCLLNTAGSVLVFLEVGDVERALASAEHIWNLSIRERGRFHGAIPAGENSKYVYAFYMAFAVKALVALYRRTGTERYLDLAVRSIRWVIGNMMHRDGRISELKTLKNRNLRDVFADQFLTWQAVFVDVFAELEELTDEKGFREAKARLSNWLRNIQNEDGSLSVYSRPVINRLAHSLHSFDLSHLRDERRRIHATGNATALQAYISSSDWGNAERLNAWMADRLSENGLFYQYYFDNGHHSVEEDVMPTAYFGITLIKNRQCPLFAGSEDTIERIAEGLSYAQFTSSDSNLDGGMKGLPLHETEDQNAYCWDTQYGILFLSAMLSSVEARPV